MNEQVKPLDDSFSDEQFLDRIAEILDHGALCVMLSIGHRLRLFNALAQMPPGTSAEIAQATGLAERYVREWLAAMVVGKILRYDPVARTYHLPPPHAACLTDGAPLGNLPVYAQMITMAGQVEPRILECFTSGEGLSYADYPCFHEVMAEDSGQTVVDNIEQTLATLVPDIVERLESGIEALDAGCGAGRAVIAMAERFPKSVFRGYDLCADAIQMGKRVASDKNLNNVDFRVVDLAGWDEESNYDFVTSFDAVHDTKNPQALLDRIHRALRPGGVHLMQDIGGSAHLENNIEFPFAAFLYMISTVHCTPVSLAQGGLGLGTMWGWETAERMLREAGFAASSRTVLAHDPMNVWFVSRRGH